MIRWRRLVCDYEQRIDVSQAMIVLEGGYPIPLGRRWLLEPQAQIIYQTVSVRAVTTPIRQSTGTRAAQ